MAVDAGDVFLVAGQMLVPVDGGGKKLSPVIEHRVLVAQNERLAMHHVNSMEPSFRPVGSATLLHYETSAADIRSAIAAGGDAGALEVLGGPFVDGLGQDAFLMTGRDDKQVVVVAGSESDALARVAKKLGFNPVTCTSLHTFESTAKKLRAAVDGGDCGWKLLVAPGMAH